MNKRNEYLNLVGNMTREQFFNNTDLVSEIAVFCGLKGAPYQKIVGQGKNCRVVTRYKEVRTNEGYFEWAKQYHAEAVSYVKSRKM